MTTFANSKEQSKWSNQAAYSNHAIEGVDARLDSTCRHKNGKYAPKAMAELIIANPLVSLADTNRTIKSDLPNGAAKIIPPVKGPSFPNVKTNIT